MRRKWRLVPAVLCLVMLFSSCSLFSYQNIGDLLHAPRLGQGQGEIQDALAAYLGEEPQYKFPKEGAHRSPLVVADLNGDGTDEGVLFFTLASGTGASAADVNMAILENANDEWRVVRIERGMRTDVASVEVADMFGDGTHQLIVGYSTSILTSKVLVLYWYTGPDFESLSSSVGDYTHYLLDDFTGTGRLDIARVYMEEESGLRLDFITAQNEKFERVQKTVELYNNFAACKGIYSSLGPNGERLLVVDGEIGGNLASQILNYSASGEGFYARPQAETTEMAKTTLRRFTLLTSRDIDNDGKIEIPVDTQDSYQIISSEKNLREVIWYDFLGTSAEIKQYGVLDLDRNIYVRLPDAWKDFYEVSISTAYGEWQVEDRRTGEILLQLRSAIADEALPGEEKRVPDTANLYFFPASSVGAVDRNQIRVYSLV